MLLNKVTKGTVGVQNEDTVFEGRLLREGRRVAVTIEDATKPDDIEVPLFFFVSLLIQSCVHHIKLHLCLKINIHN